MQRVSCIIAAILAASAIGLPAFAAEGGASATVAAERPVWMRSPSITLMTGFIYEPLKPYTIQQWQEGLGSRFDADAWVRDFQEVGAQYVIFYDKWIDGLVFHDTKTTGFKTKRDFVAELAASCQRRGLKLVFYFNAISDGNPEFDAWATRDRVGKPIVFAPSWPTRYQTLHSPFREKALAQARELLTRYGPVDGVWHDIFEERLDTSSPFVAAAYEKMFGENFSQATGDRLDQFNVRTLCDWLDGLEAIRREAKQDRCIYTSNGSGSMFLASGRWTREVGSRLHYLMDEGHTFQRNDLLARMAWLLPKPYEVNFLLCSSWFTPLGDAPPSHLSEAQVLAASAVVLCRGANVNFALTPGHDGRFGQDIQRAKAVGRWFRGVEKRLVGAEPHGDVGIVLGTPDPAGSGFTPPLWKAPRFAVAAAPHQAFALEDAILRAGATGRVLYSWSGRGSWPDRLGGYAAILLPEHATLDAAHAAQIRRYVEQGGTLVAFGQASRGGIAGAAAAQASGDFALADLFGVRYRGEVTAPVDVMGATVRTDSEYSPEYAAAHLLDEAPTAWASGGTPMPHWAEITLPKPIEVRRIELINREGPYQVVDADVDWADGSTWRPAASVRHAQTRTIVMTPAKPFSAQRIRVTIRRELYEGKDRQWADIEAIRVLDAAGRNWARAGDRAMPVRGASADWARWAAEGLSMPPQAVEVAPASAEVLARFELPGGPPAVTQNRVDRGRVIYVATSDQALRNHDAFWASLRRAVLSEPTLEVTPDDASRYRFILTRVRGRHVLHVVDAAVPPTGYRPKQVTIALDAARLGQPRRATLAGTERPTRLERAGGQIRLVVTPAPVASVVLE